MSSRASFASPDPPAAHRSFTSPCRAPFARHPLSSILKPRPEFAPLVPHFRPARAPVLPRFFPAFAPLCPRFCPTFSPLHSTTLVPSNACKPRNIFFPLRTGNWQPPTPQCNKCNPMPTLFQIRPHSPPSLSLTSCLH